MSVPSVAVPNFIANYFKKEVRYTDDESTTPIIYWRSALKHDRTVALMNCKSCEQEKICLEVEYNRYPMCQECITLYFTLSKMSPEDELKMEQKKLQVTMKQLQEMKDAKIKRRQRKEKLKAEYKTQKLRVKELESAGAATTALADDDMIEVD
jgi:hypothetical protein